MEPNQGIKAWQWVVTVIVIVVLIILGYYIFKGDKADAPETETETSTESTSTSGINSVVVSDQYPGNIVYVTSAQLAKAGFVVIHEDNAGKPGAIIGSTYFDEGINPGKQITLTKKTNEGKIYYAMIHTDDGDEKFDETKDLPLLDSRGNMILKTFRVTSTVTEIKG